MMFDVFPSPLTWVILGHSNPHPPLFSWFLGDEKNWMSNIEKRIPTKVEKKWTMFEIGIVKLVS
jgi:hypothetical protein